ncbi:MAG: hypothetical protein H7243_06310 [Sphingomonadaceae bacterium]|nr:hypothetical protein [Sphingomonadaceae bacterium]
MANELTTSLIDELNPYFAKVIGFVDKDGEYLNDPIYNQFHLLINVGAENDVRIGARVVVFALGPNLSDPDTGQTLGHFEIVRGEGKIVSLQSRMSVVASSRMVTERYTKALAPIVAAVGYPPEQGTREVPAPFRNPAIGDLVRFV